MSSSGADDSTPSGNEQVQALRHARLVRALALPPQAEGLRVPGSADVSGGVTDQGASARVGSQFLDAPPTTAVAKRVPGCDPGGGCRSPARAGSCARQRRPYGAGSGRHAARRPAHRGHRRDVPPGPRCGNGPARSGGVGGAGAAPVAGVLLIVSAGGGVKQTLVLGRVVDDRAKEGDVIHTRLVSRDQPLVRVCGRRLRTAERRRLRCPVAHLRQTPATSRPTSRPARPTPGRRKRR